MSTTKDGGRYKCARRTMGGRVVHPTQFAYPGGIDRIELLLQDPSF
jgi:hypothetical protein